MRCYPTLEMRLLGVAIWQLGLWAPEQWMLVVPKPLALTDHKLK